MAHLVPQTRGLAERHGAAGCSAGDCAMIRRTGMRLAAAALLLAVGAGAREAPVAATPGEDPAAYVDPLIGTGGNGHVFPGATVP
ncbi:hypothetical protein G6O49_23510, partial [Salmonella enterica subsp. enterica serovar Enteritidis]|nr:hypothetical protein [Salmonella enterica subsp. enterica serovar Enteritidis]